MYMLTVRDVRGKFMIAIEETTIPVVTKICFISILDIFPIVEG